MLPFSQDCSAFQSRKKTTLFLHAKRPSRPLHRLRHLRRRLPLRRLDAEGQPRQDSDVLYGRAGVSRHLAHLTG